MTDLLAPLSLEQSLLLRTMATEYLRSRRWPVWHFVQATLNREDLDADRVLESLPRAGGRLWSKAYGLAWWDEGPTENSRPGLTIAAVHHFPELRPVIGRPFLLVLEKLVEVQRNLPLSPDEIKTATYTPDDIKQALPTVSDEFMAGLSDILDHEPPTWDALRKVSSDWTWWQRELNREVVRYKDLRDIRSYVERVSELVAPEPLFGRSFIDTINSDINIGPAVNVAAPVAQALALSSAPPAAPVYVKESLIKELEAKNGTAQWDLTKLVQLARELNSNYAAENPYACHALLRSILDHVAPVFGQKTFEQVASQPLATWSKTDKDYLRLLKDFKAQSHDALHRHIRKTPDLIDMHDVPSKTWLNGFLRLVIDTL